MLQYANLSFILYSILKLLTNHTFVYRLPSLSYQRSNRSGFFGPPCIVTDICRRRSSSSLWAATL